jgi:hypothetical protein
MPMHTAIKSGYRAGLIARRGSRLLLSAVASGALAVGALNPAGVANASCASFSGVNIGAGCTSSFSSFALAIGPNATATANGGLDTALAIGNNASAGVLQGSLNGAVALGNKSLVQISSGHLDALLAVGNQAQSCNDFGTGNLAIAIGNPGSNDYTGPPLGDERPPQATNTYAYTSGTFNRALALGKGALAWSTGHEVNGTALALGPGNYAITLNQHNNTALAVGNRNTAIANNKPHTLAVAFGSHKKVNK